MEPWDFFLAPQWNWKPLSDDLLRGLITLLSLLWMHFVIHHMLRQATPHLLGSIDGTAVHG